jgi:polyisoprenoid-binding protein YceI
VDHLESDDFFSVKSHKTAELKITKVNKTKSENGWDFYQVFGDMKIKGISNQVKFIAKVKKSDAGVQAEAKIELDRTKWNVQYGSSSFFDSLGDKAIYDDFELEIYIKI